MVEGEMCDLFSQRVRAFIYAFDYTEWQNTPDMSRYIQYAYLYLFTVVSQQWRRGATENKTEKTCVREERGTTTALNIQSQKTAS